MQTDLARKLRLQNGQRILVLHRPNTQYFSEFDVCTIHTHEMEEIIVIFVYSLDQLVTEIMEIIKKNMVKEEGRIFIAYPKKGNIKYHTYIHRDAILPALQVDEEGYIPNTLYKFNLMIKFDATYTLLGLKRERKKRQKRSRSCVEDYKNDIPRIQEALLHSEQALQFFNCLTIGYQKDWARYVYSAKQEQTRLKRIQVMIQLLEQNIKSRNGVKKKQE